MFAMHPAQVMRIHPVSHALSRVFSLVSAKQGGANYKNDSQANYKTTH